MKNDATLYQHNYQHFENLQMSAQDFYKHLTDVISQYQYPYVGFKIESAFLSDYNLMDKRDYLSIRYLNMRYLVCAAPFGKSYFISWWFRQSSNDFVLFLQRIPILGRMFTPGKPSLYKRDTEVMFIQSIENIVRAEVDKIIADKGFTVDNPAALVA